jgi:hypothetical protein
MEPLTNQDTGLIIENETSGEITAVLFWEMENCVVKRLLRGET